MLSVCGDVVLGIPNRSGRARRPEDPEEVDLRAPGADRDSPHTLSRLYIDTRRDAAIRDPRCPSGRAAPSGAGTRRPPRSRRGRSVRAPHCIPCADHAGLRRRVSAYLRRKGLSQAERHRDPGTDFSGKDSQIRDLTCRRLRAKRYWSPHNAGYDAFRRRVQ